MTDGTPAPIDRAALERIIQRAAELQTAEREIGEGLTPDEVLALGREVGIPGRYLQQALLEERARIVQAGPEGFLSRTVGPAAIAAQRVVRGEREAIEGTLVRWMDKNELLSVQRHLPGRITWEPTGGFQAAYRRAVAAAGGTKRPIMLARVDAVSCTVLELEPGYCNVALTATARKARAESVGASAALASAGAVGTAVLAAVGAIFPVVLIPLPLGLGLGYMALRRYGPVFARIQLGLERALDQLEHGSRADRLLPPTPPRLLELLADEVRKALKS
ncbi:MAG TPA: hypothetical protein VM094_00980 [Gemmatimonadales bacterium]|nr:hypothetical protein [Gemmatimonadales bacterium]